jgi:hypothetical protein
VIELRNQGLSYLAIYAVLVVPAGWAALGRHLRTTGRPLPLLLASRREPERPATRAPGRAGSMGLTNMRFEHARTMTNAERVRSFLVIGSSQRLSIP